MEKKYGKGKAILIGSFLALAYQEQHNASTGRLLLALARAAGVSQEIEVSGPGTSELEVRRMVGERVQILFAFNHADSLANANFSVRLPWPVSEARDLVNDRRLSIQGREGIARFQETLAGGQILVLRLERR